MLKKILKSVFTGMIIIGLAGCSLPGRSWVKPQKQQISNDGELVVDYIDVGQGDSELIQVSGKTLLIDAGTEESETSLIKYLKDKNIKKIDYVIATHPHEDHIGGMDKVISTFEIGEFYSPKVSANTRTYENMVDSLNKRNLKVNVLKDGTSGIDLGEAKVNVFAPKEESYEDLNNYSPFIKVTYGEKSFLFTGDAEELREKEELNRNSDIAADVLKVGHHGSTSSTSQKFLNKVNPSTAVISVGKNNKYKHPADKTLKKLQKKNIQIFRTDKDGSIEIKTDGSKIDISAA